MKKKYVLSGATKEIRLDCRTYFLHQIVAIRDIVAPDGTIVAKKGDFGGWVEHDDNLLQKGSCWVADDAKVFENATIAGNALIEDEAKVFGKAKIFEDAHVMDSAQIFGDAIVFGHALIYGNPRIYENAKIFGFSCAYGDMKVHGNAVLAFGTKKDKANNVNPTSTTKTSSDDGRGGM